jgi:predicted CoA-binding protein
MSDLSCRLPQYDPARPEVEEARLRAALIAAKTIAVVGLSSDEWRPSHSVSEYMQSQGYRIVPVNPHEREVLGEKAYPTLEAIPFPIDIVDIFRRSDAAGEFVNGAIKLGARAVWMQESVFDEAAAARARAAGIPVAMDRCILKDHMRWKRQAPGSRE